MVLVWNVFISWYIYNCSIINVFLFQSDLDRFNSLPFKSKKDRLIFFEGLRFIRVLPLMNISDILQYVGLIRKARTIRIIEIISKFVSIWFCVAGCVHLMENSGDFFCNYCNRQEINLFNSIYFMIITMTTVSYFLLFSWEIYLWIQVGYGDISCKTYLAKSVVLLSLLTGLVMRIWYL